MARKPVRLRRWLLDRPIILSLPGLWCWARLTASVVNLYKPQAALEACRVVEVVKGFPAGTCCTVPPGCNTVGNTARALCNHSANVSSSGSVSTHFTLIYDEIDANRPVILKMKPAGGADHVVAVVGAGEGRENTITIDDPDEHNPSGSLGVADFEASHKIEEIIFTKDSAGWWGEECRYPEIEGGFADGRLRHSFSVTSDFEEVDIAREAEENIDLIRYSKRAPEGRFEIERRPLEVWSASLFALDDSRQVGWLLRLVDGEAVVGGISILRGLDSATVHYSGMYSVDFVNALGMAEKLIHNWMGSGQFRLRLLRIPEAYFTAVWVLFDNDEFFVPLPPTSFAVLDSGREGVIPFMRLSKEELIDRMSTVRETMEKMPPL